MELNRLQITAPLQSERKEPELAARFGNVAAAYCIAAFAGALLVLLVAVLLHLQNNLAVDVIPLLGVGSAVAAVFAVGFFMGRMKPRVPR